VNFSSVTEAERVGARRIARLVEPIHSVGYYGREIHELTDRERSDWRGYRGWWQAYFAYRAAPLGEAPAPAVTAAFYNFAPRMVEKAVPEVWSFGSPADTITRRDEVVDRALRRTFASELGGSAIAEAAELARRAVADADVAGRVLFGAHMGLDWPSDDEPHRVLWHACTMLRELRGDSHAIALAAAEVDGCQSHLLMTARGTGNRATIQKIRGWNDEEWDHAARSLAERGWLTADGLFTDEGQRARIGIERHTDRLSAQAAQRLGEADLDRFEELLGSLVATVLAVGEVPGTWPPPDLKVLDPA
jgi:hypothetical protein